MSAEPHLKLGWREWVGLPKIGIARIKAKIDTGALTSTLHAFEVEEFEFDDKPFVRFKIHPIQRDDEFVTESIAEVIEKRNAPRSKDQQQDRWVIETDLHIGDQKWPIQINLVAREDFMFRMVLGRSAIAGRAMVDPASAFLLGKSWKKNK
ncbi:MAG TPA: RimK/LysX family protein [Xanthomonadales bacterium]|nr:RimK/LysX family protein [Xanthomonadales bacterium]